MKLKKCVEAYAALLELMPKEWEYQTAYALASLKRQLQAAADFYMSEELRLVNEFAGRDKDGNIEWTGAGKFRFADPGRAGEYLRRRAELGDVEVREEITPLRAPAPERISPAQLAALDAFIRFVAPETEEPDAEG